MKFINIVLYLVIERIKLSPKPMDFNLRQEKDGQKVYHSRSRVFYTIVKKLVGVTNLDFDRATPPIYSRWSCGKVLQRVFEKVKN